MDETTLEMEIEDGLSSKGIAVKKVRAYRQKTKPSKFLCLICNETFDSRTGKGKMHMAGHGYSLEGALQLGKATLQP